MISTPLNINDAEIKILNILRKNKYCIAILEFVKQFSKEELWIGGGFIRNIVWDEKHTHKVNSEFGDIDVFYFNLECLDKDQDIAIENVLRGFAPNVEWSVKNQARMHKHNNEAPYKSLEDALSKFPDTASSILVRLNANDDIEFIAPYGYSDLFNLIVKPTPIFLHNKFKMRRYNQRIEEKKWKLKWPNLRFYEENS